jgi:cyanophycinase
MENDFTLGPPKGNLLLHGGGNLDSDFKELFRGLAGGFNASIVYIPTSLKEEELRHEKFHMDSNFAAQQFGVKQAIILHTRDRDEANSDNFVQPLRDVNAVFFTGGHQWLLADSYLNTKTHEELKNLLLRGGIIAGSSSGATIQGSFMVRGNSDPDDPKIMIGDHRDGFGFIKNCAIDQHLLIRNRQFDMFEVIQKYPGLLGIGIDAETSIWVKGNELEVRGNSYVAIYSENFAPNEGTSLSDLETESKKFYLLWKGSRYDMESRKILYLSNI